MIHYPFDSFLSACAPLRPLTLRSLILLLRVLDSVRGSGRNYRHESPRSQTEFLFEYCAPDSLSPPLSLHLSLTLALSLC